MRHDLLTRIAVRSCLLGTLGAGGLLAQEPATFVRGDLNQNGRPEVTDAVIILRFLFAGERVACEDAADVDDDGQLAVTDPLHLLGSLFAGGPAPPAPFPDCGTDPTDDGLGCQAYELCDFAFTFYGVNFSADGIFFVIDRSGSMLDSGELARSKQEVIRVLQGVPAETRFGIIYFDRHVVKFPASGVPAEASAEMKASAASFVQTVTQGGSDTCGGSALHAALDFVEASAGRQDEIIYLSDGGGTCSGESETAYLARTLAEVFHRNRGQARIHTIGVLDVGPVNQIFLTTLAAQHGGTFTRIR